jgi:hypothetical protein
LIATGCAAERQRTDHGAAPVAATGGGAFALATFKHRCPCDTGNIENPYSTVRFGTLAIGVIPMSSLYQPQTTKLTPWFSLKSLADPNLQAVVLFCALGLLLTVLVMISFPDFGAIIAQYSQF